MRGSLPEYSEGTVWTACLVHVIVGFASPSLPPRTFVSFVVYPLRYDLYDSLCDLFSERFLKKFSLLDTKSFHIFQSTPLRG